ncbi:MAG: hypothetical protein D6E12_17790 [Desulfovibrio sp.]|nr:MAG: hypothetical protein D6E12_17790 [Desulfovibrio sp.]
MQDTNFFFRPDKDQCKDAGMALVFGLLLVAVIWDVDKLFPWALIVTGVLMLWPTLFKPWAALWFGLSNLLGMIMPKVLLSLLFFLMVLPMGVLRRMLGKDTLKLKQWKAGDESVFQERKGLVKPEDLEQLF